MTIENWFSVPVLYYDLSEEEFEKVQDSIQLAMPKILKLDLGNPWGDSVETSFKYKTDCNLIEDMGLEVLKTVIMDQATLFCQSYDLNYTLRLKESWVNISKKQGFQYPHNHLPFLFSGVYFYQTNGEDGSLQFKSPNPWLNAMTYPFGYDKITYRPIEGRLIMFPAYLEHLVNLNNTASTRISLSFNIECN